MLGPTPHSRRFALTSGKIPVTRSTVKSGWNHPVVARACRCINVALFVSHDLRRNVEIEIVQILGDTVESVLFGGASLRRVTPDERSIAFFLLKASNTLLDLDVGGQTTLPNGIVVAKMRWEDMVGRLQGGRAVYVARGRSPRSVAVSCCGAVFLYEHEEGVFADHLEAMPVPRPAHPERFILDVNLGCDSAQFGAHLLQTC